MATFKDCLVEARTALTSQTTITDVVAEGKITFGARPQEATQPAIVLEAQRSDYDATYDSYAKAITYRVAYLFFSQNAVQLAEMVDTIKDAVQLHSSSNFYIRIEDEGVTSDPDGNNIAYVITTWKDTQGTVANLIGSTNKTLGELVDIYLNSAEINQAADNINALLGTSTLLDSPAALQTVLDDKSEAEQQNTDWETATGGTYEEYINPPAYNAAGEIGETATGIWGFKHIADGYTGPVCQMFDANSHDGVSGADGYDTVDVYPNTLHLYVVQNYPADAITSFTDGKEWRVKKVYDQIGNNDMYFDVDDAFNSIGSYPTFGPKLQFLSGAYAMVGAGYPFRTTTPTSGEDFMVVYDCTTTNRRETILAAGGTNDGAPFRNWALTTWDSDDTALQFYYGTGAEGGQFTSVGLSSTITSVPAIQNNSTGRQCVVGSRKGGQAWLWDGTNAHTKAASAGHAPATDYTAYFGINVDSYNAASGPTDGFYALALHEGGHVADESLLEAYANKLESATGYTNHRQAYNQANS